MSDVAAQSLALPAIVDLDAIDTVRDQLIEAIDHGPVEVDASAVERVATNALLMLMSAAESARRNDSSFYVLNLSDPMTAAIARLGLGESFAPILKG
ncbi:STAS domain-containing protein [Mariluticola halotolerans]|uniref:STAS domain-containing protein n=1 Tax=Mariluticola halotolerans TaxID=2909283 RepID=UPI0026E42AE2|nr:STAS domain-containing protein [Mariluticola halotolerans]UJQ93752.1 STAS domain-containing protein [Mariluticola halotolerans]